MNTTIKIGKFHIISPVCSPMNCQIFPYRGAVASPLAPPLLQLNSNTWSNLLFFTNDNPGESSI